MHSPSSAAPILVADRLPLVEAKLLELLGNLSIEDWEKPTIVPRWRVKHIAAHLLDTALRKLAIVRDGYAIERPASNSPADVRVFVDRLNAEGVAVFSRMSPALIRSLMESASRQMCDFQLSLDPFARAAFAVSWAGEEQSLNWFDTARDLTERWHHQQQIRMAVDQPGIMTPELYAPVIDCFMRALPYAYRDVPARDGAWLRVIVDGPCGGEWRLLKMRSGWVFSDDTSGDPAAAVTVPEGIAWRIFTKGIDPVAAQELIKFEGDRELALKLLGVVAIVG